MRYFQAAQGIQYWNTWEKKLKLRFDTEIKFGIKTVRLGIFNFSTFFNINRQRNYYGFATKAKITKKAEPQARDSAFILFLLKNYLAGTDVI